MLSDLDWWKPLNSSVSMVLFELSAFPLPFFVAVRCYCKKTTAELEESISIAAAGWSHVVMCCPNTDN